MIFNNPNPFLFAPAESGAPAAAGTPPAAPAADSADNGGGEGGDEDEDDSDSPEGDEPEAPAAPEAAAEPKHIGIVDRAKLHLKGKGHIINQLAASYEENGKLHADNLRLRARVLDLEKAEGKLKQAEVEKTTVQREVRRELTSLGVTEAEAPAQLAPANTPEGLLDTFKGLKGAEKTAFFRQHEKALMAAEAVANKSK